MIKINSTYNGYPEKILMSVSKPGRYTGGEFGQIIKDKSEVKARMAFAFPDSYEIGMCNLGIRILYGVLNEVPGFWCERAYTPWIDMQRQLRENNLVLRAHESGDELYKFDIVGFTLQYELCYTNVLSTLELGRIPLLAADRGEDDPIVIGGGPCAYNAEPLTDFFDCFSIGEGEDMLPEFARLYIKMKEDGSYTRVKFLRECAHIPGMYVPSLYDVGYDENGDFAYIRPKYPDVPAVVTKRIVDDMDKAYFPDKLVMPYIETVQDRIVLETYRGCIRGCRFCQAGMVFRPVREKSPETLDACARRLYAATGYEEMTLSSLSISDYSELRELTDRLLEWTDEKKVSLSLPSLRLDSFSEELMQKVSSVRNSGLTFAPEAGTQRLRDVINKNVTEEDLLRAAGTAFRNGKTGVKLYFMDGLPTETYEDLDGIAELANKVVDEYFRTPGRMKGKTPSVTVSVACFVPKPFTPFQWAAQDTYETLVAKQKYLSEKLKSRYIKFNWHDSKTSFIEAAFARGDRRLNRVLLRAYRLGCSFDAWDECFDFDKWLQAFSDSGVDPVYYANRELDPSKPLPWDVIDVGIKKEFFIREYEKAHMGKTTKSCAEACAGCGVNRLGGKNRWCPKYKEEGV